MALMALVSAKMKTLNGMIEPNTAIKGKLCDKATQPP